MKKTTHCNCKSGCKNSRCVCIVHWEPCDDGCKCTDCQNPFNGVDVENLTECALQNIWKYRGLTEDDLEKEYELPCEHEKVPLKDLTGEYGCTKCGTIYWYSLCWDEVVQDSETWHCKICGQCRDAAEWHCKKCNRCTYGLSMPCEYCGARSPYNV